MKLIKPKWHIGKWTKNLQKCLIEELVLAERERSLTNEELAWLISVSPLN